jgi:hypothetical protein
VLDNYDEYIVCMLIEYYYDEYIVYMLIDYYNDEYIVYMLIEYYYDEYIVYMLIEYYYDEWLHTCPASCNPIRWLLTLVAISFALSATKLPS